MKVSSVAALFAIALSSSSAVWAEQPIAVSSKVGTLGMGLDLTMGLNPDLNLRVGFQTYPVDLDQGVDRSGSALLDWHLGHSPIRISGGLGLLRQGRFEGHDWNAAPYLGLGWGNAVRPGSRFGFALDVGTFYNFGVGYSSRGSDDALHSGETAATRSKPLSGTSSGSTGRIFTYSAFQPVVSFGMSYRF